MSDHEQAPVKGAEERLLDRISEDPDLERAYFENTVLRYNNEELLGRIATLEARVVELETESRIHPVTGLYTKKEFELDLANEVARSIDTEMDINLALILIDVDGLKNVNDIHGMEMGDKLIAAAAKGIEKQVRGYDKAYHLFGDDFAVMILVPKDETQSEEEFVDNLEKRYKFTTGMDIGLADIPEDINVGASAAAAILQPGESVKDFYMRTEKRLKQMKRLRKERLEEEGYTFRFGDERLPERKSTDSSDQA